jgi:lysosomal acid lipase/cholesteryl ester hydrolase
MPPGDEESMPSTTAFDTTQSSSERPVRFRVDPRYSKIYAKQPLQRPRSSSFVSPAHEPVGVSRNFRFKFQFFLDQTFAVLVSSFFLILVVCWATLLRIASALPRFLRPTKKTAAFPWDTYDFKNEKVTKEVAYYARQVGFDIVDETAETEDGFYLK